MKTAIDGLELRCLSGSDADAYYALVDVNRAHLSRHGDYTFERDATPEQIREHLDAIPEQNIAFGVWLGDDLAGRVDLIQHTPQRYGIGYWLGEAFTGRGLATAAVATLIAYARDDRGATDVFAGVTHGNAPSVALLTRLGFCDVADFEQYTRFHVSLSYPGASSGPLDGSAAPGRSGASLPSA